ncbi:hypothetical protein ACFLZH_03850 [Patescibacteria group bacterium]
MAGFQKQRSLREAMDGRREALEEAREALENDDGTLEPEMRGFYERLLASEKDVIVELNPRGAIRSHADILRKRRLADEARRALEEDDGELHEVQRESFERILKAAGEELLGKI